MPMVEVSNGGTVGNPYDYIKMACDYNETAGRGVFTSGSTLSVYGYSPCVIANISGLSGTAVCTTNANGIYTVLGIKSDGSFQRLNTSMSTTTSQTVTFSGYEYIIALVGNNVRLTLSVNITIN